MKAKNKRIFSNCIIVYCVAYMSVYLWRCLNIIQTTDVNPSTCVTVAGAFFGGELLTICLAYVFGKRSSTKQSTATTAGSSDADCTI